MGLDELGEQLDIPEDVDQGDVPSYVDSEEESTEQDSLFKSEFDKVEEFSGPPQAWFEDPEYYKNILTGVGDTATRVHEILVAYLKATDPADRNVYRVRLISAYWNLFHEICPAALDCDGPDPKRLMFRFGLLLPNLVSEAHQKMVASIFFDKKIDEAVWYSDEWVSMVGHGQVAPLASDEPVAKRGDGNSAADVAKWQGSLEKAAGQLTAFKAVLLELEQQRNQLVGTLAEMTQRICETNPSTEIIGVLEPFTEAQRADFSALMEVSRSLSTLARAINSNYEGIKDAKSKKDQAERELDRLNNNQTSSRDEDLVKKESQKIGQLVHMSVGRKGNHFPILATQFFSPDIKNVGSRENIIQIMSEIEEIDPEVFLREFRRHVHRIPPHVILIPCYGSYGVCWEPYERTNRATSRGRIAVPMFPQNLKTAVIWAIADFRWNYAKDKAAHYWMEEGLTGQFYQWFSETKQRGDVRLSFIENYVLWVTKESEGMQKLDREVRGIFWRTIPFSQERRENLKMRGFVYDDLYKKDLNRAKMM
ncbi:MAG: hypothetical protein ACRCVN_03260 [Spirochaetia bacterium]